MSIKFDPMLAARFVVEALHRANKPLSRIEVIEAVEASSPSACMSHIDASLHWLVSMRIVKRTAQVERHAGKYTGEVEKSHHYHYELEAATPQALIRALRDTFQWLDAWSRSGGYELSKSLMLSDILVRIDGGASDEPGASSPTPKPRTPHNGGKRGQTKAGAVVESFRDGKMSAPGGYTGDFCSCGGMLKANGGCQVCTSCGSSTGCG